MHSTVCHQFASSNLHQMLWCLCRQLLQMRCIRRQPIYLIQTGSRSGRYVVDQGDFSLHHYNSKIENQTTTNLRQEKSFTCRLVVSFERIEASTENNLCKKKNKVLNTLRNSNKVIGFWTSWLVSHHHVCVVKIQVFKLIKGLDIAAPNTYLTCLSLVFRDRDTRSSYTKVLSELT